MADRYIRDGELIANAILATRRGVRDVQRPTGTEKALTRDTAIQAATDADVALEAAQQAAEDALKAQTTADGRNRIFVGADEPTPPPEAPFVNGDVWYVTDPDGHFESVKVWNGSAFAAYQFVADMILVPGSVGPVLIEDGAVTAIKLSADAIDGKVITGATLRTAATGQRMQFDTNGMSSFNSAGIRTAILTAGDGSFQLLGAGGTVNDPSGSLSYSGVGFGAGGRLTPGGLYKRSASLNPYNLTVTDRDPDSDYEGSTTRVESYFTESAHSVNATPSSPRTYTNAVATADAARVEVYKTNGVSASVSATLSAFYDSTLGRDSTRLTAEQLQIALGGNCGGPLTFFGSGAQLRVSADEVRSTITNGTPLKLSSASGDIEVTAGAGKKIKALSTVDAPSVAVTGAATAATVAASTSVASPAYNNPAGGKSAPYAIAVGQALSSAGVYTTVIFPVGRFTVPPRMQCLVVETTGSQVSIPWVPLVDVKAASFKVIAFTIGGGAINAVHHWTATQMTPTAADG